MPNKKKGIIFLILILLVVLIRWYSANFQRVEGGYATGIYPKIAAFLRTIFGWLPFSIGDIIYGLMGLWLLIKIIKGIRNIFKRKLSWKGVGKSFAKGVLILLGIYVSFNLFWGINYSRKGIAYQLKIEKDTIATTDVVKLNEFLVHKVNDTKLSLLLSKQSYPTNKQLFKRVAAAYQSLDSVYPFLHYSPTSIKSSMWGWLGNYLGFTGYYNPFTGEAQVNTTIPKFIQPFTTLHEVGHQLGYAKENEANFVGFLAGIHSADTLLQYSTYLDMFLYSNRNLFLADTTAAKKYAKALIPQVRADLAVWRKFNENHKSFAEPIIRWGYSHYLKQNNQPQGLLSYDGVTNFLVLYYKKQGVL
jgi:Protein of unknown function (DUF3810)